MTHAYDLGTAIDFIDLQCHLVRSFQLRLLRKVVGAVARSVRAIDEFLVE